MTKQIFRLDFTHTSAELRERFLHRAPLYVVDGNHQKDFDVIETSANAALIQKVRHINAINARRAKNKYTAVGYANPLGVDYQLLLLHNVELKPITTNGEELIYSCSLCDLKTQETPSPCHEHDCNMIAESVKTHASFWEIEL